MCSFDVDQLCCWYSIRTRRSKKSTGTVAVGEAMSLGRSHRKT
jgi:hypothetical protein